ncbi:MAG: OmpA family protein [Treponemataceae bacterium]
MKKKQLWIILAIALSISLPIFAEKFEFQYSTGDAYRILSTIDEDVFIDGNLHHKTQIVNRISVKVTQTNSDGSAVHEAHFMTTEKSIGVSNAVYNWGEEYESIFTRYKNGAYSISDEYFMPVVRDVPVFPDKELSPGETWEYQGHETHDLRQNFNIEKPFKVPFNAKYTYQGTFEQNGKLFYVIKVSYQLLYNNPIPQNLAENENINDYPIVTRGFSNQTLYWDNEKGLIQFYDENFRIEIETLKGRSIVFKGKAKAEIDEIEQITNKETIAKVQEQIEKLGIENTAVNSDEKGITISIENIQFKADSAVLEKSEIVKLRKIAKILEAFPNNDLLVSGHTARAGSEESCQRLSEERANSVAAFFVESDVKDAQHIFTQGFGSKKPIAPNYSTSGMARNRRVEITIMEQ